tara:strand:- start:729 stop:1307 length:579 start_codon:yes stop_codon:yes gene_type:complete
MKELLIELINHVSKSLGPGHSEIIYQKALSILLDHHNIKHSCEFHVPVSISYESNKYNIGDERIDILIYDNLNSVYILELKAIQGSIYSTTKITDNTSAHPAHIQLMKYIRLLESNHDFLESKKKINIGFVINFRQSIKFNSLSNMNIEIDYFDNINKKWNLNENENKKKNIEDINLLQNMNTNSIFISTKD